MSPNDKSSSETNNNKSTPIPDWLSIEFFRDVVQKDVGPDYEVKKFTPIAAFGSGENYASDMLRIEIEVELPDNTIKELSYIFKIFPQNEFGGAVVSAMNLFPKEIMMYSKIIPEFEKLYADIGKNIIFGPKCLAVSNKHGGELILEDLKEKKFRNVVRQTGLDMAHCKRVLEKLAQFHAASACWYEKNGSYPDLFLKGMSAENMKEMFEKMHETNSKLYRDCVMKYKNGEKYVDKIEKFQNSFIELLDEYNVIDPEDFNVLNHGDLWCNNIMFQYKNDGDLTNGNINGKENGDGDDDNINELYFVDYQISKYGSPAIDLFYFLITSCQYEIRIPEFDYFIKYYHDKLVENLKLLQYPKRIPLLREIHIQMFKNKFGPLGTAMGVLTAVLMDPNDDASIENFLESTDAGVQFKLNGYMNARYVKTMESLFPFFDNRGLLDF